MFGFPVSLLVCPPLFGLFVRQDTFKSYALNTTGRSGEKVVSRWSTIDRNGLEAIKPLFRHEVECTFKCDDYFNVQKLHLTQL